MFIMNPPPNHVNFVQGRAGQPATYITCLEGDGEDPNCSDSVSFQLFEFMNTHEHWPKFIAAHYFHLTFKSASDVLYQVKIPVQNTYTSIYTLSQSCVGINISWFPLHQPFRTCHLMHSAFDQLVRRSRPITYFIWACLKTTAQTRQKPLVNLWPHHWIIIITYYYSCYQLWYGSDAVRFWIFMNPEWCQKRFVAAVNTTERHDGMRRFKWEKQIGVTAQHISLAKHFSTCW